MDAGTPEITDSQLRDRILAGLAASEELQARFRQPLERHLIGLCDRGAGRSQAKAVEIASTILAECFVKKPSLLERWQGPDNLQAFLRTAAHNRLKTWWASPDSRVQEINPEAPETPAATVLPGDADDEETRIAEAALRAGVQAAAAKCPDGLVFLRLKGLHGADQRAISRYWGHHEAQTSRRIKEANELIRTTAIDHAARAGSDGLTWDVLRLALQRDPLILLGREEPGGAEDTPAILKRLAAGGADAATRAEAVKRMCAEPRMLRFFADLLNRGADTAPVFVKDPALSGASARISECARRSLELLQPAEAAHLVTPLMADAFRDTLEAIGAEGGTLWLVPPGEAMLEAVFNPLEPELVGRRQPLVSGIISLVLATGESVCINPSSHRLHSPAIDAALGKTTRSLIAVPFSIEGSARGVLTAVRLHNADPFGETETRVLERHAEVQSALFTRALVAEIVG